jgi:hypothetical protein
MRMTREDYRNRRELLWQPNPRPDNDAVFKFIQSVMLGSFISVATIATIGLITGQSR